ncbi:MAG: cysteine desulfurase [Bacilli bacterium]|nr:cysteine desulfurase [Bacilli bacterium]
MVGDKDTAIYFDHAATTSPLSEVVSLYSEVATKYYANPSSAHRLGMDNSRLLAKARQDILNSFKLRNHEVIFTSGATEANNLALKGYMERYASRGKHLIISNIEHPSIQNAANHLLRLGYEVTLVPARGDGKVYLEDLKKEIKDNTILVSIMGVNNETGIPQDIFEIAKFLKQFPSIALHVDAVQAVGKVDLPYNDIDLFTVSLHKLGGLKGAGLLIKKKNIELSPVLDGGGHENGYRSGTNDLAMAVVDSVVIKEALNKMKVKRAYIEELTKPLISYFLMHQDEVVINSTLENPYTINISLLHKKASVFAEFLSNNNIMVSTHSACSSKLDIGSPTLVAMGKNEVISKNAMRLSFSTLNTKEEIERFITVFDFGLKEIRG